MVKMAKEEEKMLTKLLRIICFVLLVAGWMMLFSIFTTLLSTLPILGALGNAAFFIVALIIGTVCCCGVTAIAYIRYRPLLAFLLFAIAGTIFGLVFGLLGKHQETSYQPTASPVKAPRFIYDEDEVLYFDDTDVPDVVESIY